jgi:hypothetical protein
VANITPPITARPSGVFCPGSMAIGTCQRRSAGKSARWRGRGRQRGADKRSSSLLPGRGTRRWYPWVRRGVVLHCLANVRYPLSLRLFFFVLACERRVAGLYLRSGGCQASGRQLPDVPLHTLNDTPAAGLDSAAKFLHVRPTRRPQSWSRCRGQSWADRRLCNSGRATRDRQRKQQC